MSYDPPYGQYSPYYQYLGQGHEGARVGNAYQQSKYQPLSAHQAQNTASAANSLGGQVYDKVTSASNQPVYESSCTHRAGRSSVDAANLGNLAHASSLSQAIPSRHPGSSQHASSDFRQDAQASSSSGYTRPDSRETPGRSQIDSSYKPATSRPPNGVSSPTWGGAFPYSPQQYSGNAAWTIPAPSQPYTSQAPQPSTTRHTTNQSSLHSIPLYNAQAALSTQPIAKPPFNPSPGLASLQNQAFRLPGHQTVADRRELPIQRPRSSAPASGTPEGFHAPALPQQSHLGRLQDMRNDLAEQTQRADNSHGHHKSANPLEDSSERRQSPKPQTATNVQGSQQPTSVQRPSPTTVDPSEVFNDYEHQRRKAADLAKAKAEEAARVPRGQLQETNLPHGTDSTGGPRPQSATSQRSDIVQAAQAALGSPSDTNAATKNQMELEMKQMIEKMRDYKAKDPAIFSQLWEQVKKGQGPQASSAKPQPQASSAPAAIVVDEPASPVQSELPAESELPAALPFPPDFDRGRFPYLRRNRGGLQAAPDGVSRSHVKGARFSQAPKPTHSVVNAPTAQMLPPTNQTDQNLTAAMLAFHRSINSPTSTPIGQPRNPPPQPSTNSMPNVQPPHPAGRFPGNTTFHALPSKAPPPILGKTPGSEIQPRIAPTGSGLPDSPAGKTHWPEHRKSALAEAARNYLTTTPPNSGKSITAEEIHRLLDQNPSYAQLCEHLEGKGFILNRSLFARYLLTAVPDILSPGQVLPGQRPLPSTTNDTLRGNVPSGHKSPYERPLLPPQSSSHSQLRIGAQTPSSKPIKADSQTVHTNGAMVNGPNALIQAATKENKARKRTFSDIVDLTQATSDDEDFVRHLPKSRTDTPTTAHHVIDPSKPPAPVARNAPPAGRPVDKQLEPQLPLVDQDRVLKYVLADPINKRRDAVRCSTYDPKNIARDILISSGTHPTLAPLNNHLLILRDNFESVNNDSDLSTLKWDLLDPTEQPSGEQTAPSSLVDVSDKRIDNQAEGGESTKGPPLQSKKAQKKSKRADRPIAYDALEAGKHFPNGLNNQSLEQRFSKFPARAQDKIHPNGTNTDLPMTPHIQVGTTTVDQQIRWRPLETFAHNPKAVSSTTPLIAGSSKFPPSQTSLQAKVVPRWCALCRAHNWICDGQVPCGLCRKVGLVAKDCVVEDRETGNLRLSAPAVTSANSVFQVSAMKLSSPIPPPIPNTLPQSERIRLGRRSESLVERSTNMNPLSMAKTPPLKNEVVRHRLGRPPGAKNEQPRPDKGIPKRPQPALGSVVSPRSVRTPLTQRSTPTRGSGQLHATSPANSVTVVIPSRSPSVIGSVSQPKSKFGFKVEDGSHGYEAYRCGWDQCPAELHNIATLRKHVRKHRRDLGQPIPCKWAGCGDGTNGSPTRKWLTYENESQWDRHIEKKHIRSVAKAHGEVLDGDSDEESSDQSVEDELAV